MTQAAAQTSQFFADVAQTQKVWMAAGSSGLPTVRTPDGHAVVPFWSSRERVVEIVSAVPAYQGFEPIELSWADFRDRWLPDLASKGLRIGVNWTGARALGYDFDAATVRTRVEANLIHSK